VRQTDVMGNLDPPGAPSRRFPQNPESVASARRFVRDALDGLSSDVVDTAELLVSELVTNAVVHARTEVEVSVRVLNGRVTVRVSDHRPGRGLVPHGGTSYAGTGQGLALVEQLASRHGSDTDEECKTVWFELWPDGPPPPPPSGWEAAVPPSSGETVTLVDVPDVLCSASQQHRHALLRELALAASAGERLGVRPEELVAAHDMNNVISACVTAAMKKQPSDANIHSLSLSVPADATPAVVTLRRVLDVA
jgi:anti-sigma regulatory factor (Ser/Thr protein kinase)